MGMGCCTREPNHIDEDFRDGLKLMLLLEVISGDVPLGFAPRVGAHSSKCCPVPRAQPWTLSSVLPPARAVILLSASSFQGSDCQNRSEGR